MHNKVPQVELLMMQIKNMLQVISLEQLLRLQPVLLLFSISCPFEMLHKAPLNDFKANYGVPKCICNSQCLCDTFQQGCILDASVQEVQWICWRTLHLPTPGWSTGTRDDLYTVRAHLRVCVCGCWVSSHQFMKGWWLRVACLLKGYPFPSFPRTDSIPACSLLWCCQDLWRRSSSPRATGLPSLPLSLPSILPTILPPSPLLNSARLFLSPPAPAGLAVQEPGLPWQLVLSLSRGGSPRDCVWPTRHIRLPTIQII